MLEQQRAEQRVDSDIKRLSSKSRPPPPQPRFPQLGRGRDRFNRKPGDPDTDEETEDGPRFTESVSPTSPTSPDAKASRASQGARRPAPTASPTPLQLVDETAAMGIGAETAENLNDENDGMLNVTEGQKVNAPYRAGGWLLVASDSVNGVEAAASAPLPPGPLSPPGMPPSSPVDRQLVTLGRRQSPAQIASWGSPKPNPLISTGPTPWTRSTSSAGSPPIANGSSKATGGYYGRHALSTGTPGERWLAI